MNAEVLIEVRLDALLELLEAIVPRSPGAVSGEILSGLIAAFGRSLPPLQLGSHLSSRVTGRADDKSNRAEKQIDLTSKDQEISFHLFLEGANAKAPSASGLQRFWLETLPRRRTKGRGLTVSPTRPVSGAQELR